MSTEKGFTVRTIADGPKLSAVRTQAPGTAAAIAAAQRACFEAFDRAELELVSLQVARLINGRDSPLMRQPQYADPRKVAALADWTSDPLFSDDERACLALAEQMVVSVTDVDDELLDAVLAHHEPSELFALLNAIYLFDATERLEIVSRCIFCLGGQS
jgi:alkylhydroperoxidase family enzyme